MRMIMPTLNSDWLKGRYSRYVACSIGVWSYLRLYETEYALGVAFPCSWLYFGGGYLLTFELLLNVETGRSQFKHRPLATGSATFVELIDSEAIEFAILCGPSALDWNTSLGFAAASHLSLESVCCFLGLLIFQESSSGSLDLVRPVFAELFFHESSLGRFRPAGIGFRVLV